MDSCGATTKTEDVLPPRPKFDRSEYCLRCKENRGNIVIRHAVYCKTCFFPLILVKFRKGLDPYINDFGRGAHRRRQKSLKAPGNVMIAFSGGLGSTVLLDMLFKTYFEGRGSLASVDNEQDTKGGKDHPRKELAWNRAIVCYVSHSSLNETSDSIGKLRRVVERYKIFEFMVLRLEDAFDSEWWNVPSTVERRTMDITQSDIPLSSADPTPASPVSRLKTYIGSLPSSSSIPNALENITRILLLHAAARQQCSHLVLGTSMTSSGIDLISGIAAGSGVNGFDKGGELWMPDPDVLSSPVHVSRPLSDIGMKECTAWVFWHNLEVVEGGLDRQKPSTKRVVSATKPLGISSLTQDFILGLEKDYPSTVSTIIRTCAKVMTKSLEFEGEESVGQTSDAGISSDRCIMCQRAAQVGVSRMWKSRIAITSLSPLPIDEEKASSLQLAERLCYTCHTSLISPGGGNMHKATGNRSRVPVPMWIETRLST